MPGAWKPEDWVWGATAIGQVLARSPKTVYRMRSGQDLSALSFVERRPRQGGGYELGSVVQSLQAIRDRLQAHVSSANAANARGPRKRVLTPGKLRS